MEYIIVIIIFSILIGFYARSKNRSFIGWFFISVLISPLFALIILFFLRKIE